eukprot:tig00000402_g233.t1
MWLVEPTPAYLRRRLCRSAAAPAMASEQLQAAPADGASALIVVAPSSAGGDPNPPTIDIASSAHCHRPSPAASALVLAAAERLDGAGRLAAALGPLDAWMLARAAGEVAEDDGFESLAALPGPGPFGRLGRALEQRLSAPDRLRHLTRALFSGAEWARREAAEALRLAEPAAPDFLDALDGHDRVRLGRRLRDPFGSLLDADAPGDDFDEGPAARGPAGSFQASEFAKLERIYQGAALDPELRRAAAEQLALALRVLFRSALADLREAVAAARGGDRAGAEGPAASVLSSLCRLLPGVRRTLRDEPESLRALVPYAFHPHTGVRREASAALAWALFSDNEEAQARGCRTPALFAREVLEGSDAPGPWAGLPLPAPLAAAFRFAFAVRPCGLQGPAEGAVPPASPRLARALAAAWHLERVGGLSGALRSAAAAAGEAVVGALTPRSGTGPWPWRACTRPRPSARRWARPPAPRRTPTARGPLRGRPRRRPRLRRRDVARRIPPLAACQLVATLTAEADAAMRRVLDGREAEEAEPQPRPQPSSENAAGGGGGGGGGGELGARLSERLVRLYGASRGALERAAPDRRQLRSRAAIAGALVNVLAASRTGTRAALESGVPAALIAAAEEAHAVASSLGPGGGGVGGEWGGEGALRHGAAVAELVLSLALLKNLAAGSGEAKAALLALRVAALLERLWPLAAREGEALQVELLGLLAGRARLGVAAHGAAFAALASMALVPEFRAALARTAFLADCAAALDRVARERAPRVAAAAGPGAPSEELLASSVAAGGGEGVPAAAARQAAVLHFLGNLAFSQMRASLPSSAPRVPRPRLRPRPASFAPRASLKAYPPGLVAYAVELLEERRGAPAALRLALRAGAALLLRNLAFLQEAKPHILAPGQWRCRGCWRWFGAAARASAPPAAGALWALVYNNQKALPGPTPPPRLRSESPSGALPVSSAQVKVALKGAGAGCALLAREAELSQRPAAAALREEEAGEGAEGAGGRAGRSCGRAGRAGRSCGRPGSGGAGAARGRRRRRRRRRRRWRASQCSSTCSTPARPPSPDPSSLVSSFSPPLLQAHWPAAPAPGPRGESP